VAIRAESALRHGEDPRAHARLLGKVRDEALTGGTPPAAARQVISDSWRRMQSLGVDPSGSRDVAPLDVAELQRRRASSGLEPLMPHLRAGLLPVAEAAGQVLVVVDPDSRVLWREGSAAARRRADNLGFVDGSAWDEASVGTNAIGTSLVVDAPVNVFGAEHYADSHQPWTCAAAPLHDPVTGRLLGAVDLSGPAHTVHASTVALVDAVARLCVLELRAAHEQQLSGLRSHAAPMLARVRGRALAVTADGRVAAATGLAAPGRICLPEGLAAGPSWLPAYGLCSAEALPGGWLLRLLSSDPVADDVIGLELDLTCTGPGVPVVRVVGPSGDWRHELSLRHAEILLALVEHRSGLTAAQLAGHLFGDQSRTVTARAEVSRLRRTMGPLLLHQPYRIGSGVTVRLLLPANLGLLLPSSVAPVVQAIRARNLA
jgi:GAF domain